jgi:hypothetical protein
MYPPERTQLQTQGSAGAGVSGDLSASLAQQGAAADDARLTISQRIVHDAQSANTINATNGFSRFMRDKNSDAA